MKKTTAIYNLKKKNFNIWVSRFPVLYKALGVVRKFLHGCDRLNWVHIIFFVISC